MAQRMVLFGIDGCPEELIRKWIFKENRFPNFKRLYEDGVFSTINSTLPYITVPAWISILTGKTPGALGAYSFFNRRQDSYATEVANMEWEKWDPVWSILDRYDKRSILINVPTTMPPKTDYNGILISGPIMNDDLTRIAYPETLNRKLLDESFLVDYNVSIHKNPQKSIEIILKNTKRKTDLAKKFFREEQWNFFMFVFYYGDPLLHNLWRYFDDTHPEYERNDTLSQGILDYYALIDEHLGFYLDNLPEDCNLFLISDHGMGPLKSAIDINTWLMEKGYLTLKSEHASRINIYNFQKQSYYRFLRNIYLKAQKFSFVKRTRDLFFRKIPKNTLNYTNVDWPNTKAYNYGLNILYANVAGREPDGVIQPEEYDAFLDALIADLMEFRDPSDNKPVIKEIIKGAVLYPDADPKTRPDLFFVFRDHSYYYTGSKEPVPIHPVFYKNELVPFSAYHRINTVFGAYGNDIRQGAVLKDRYIYDILPTVFELMDIPRPEKSDGRVMMEIISDRTKH